VPTHDPLDDLGLDRPLPPPRLSDRLAGVLTDLGLTPRSALTAGGVVVVALVGWWWLRGPGPTPAEAEVPLATTVPGAAVSTGTLPATGSVWAHAAGVVRRPGLYELAAGSRVADLVEAAGGARPGADLDRINLAEVVADGTQVYVPRRGEPVAGPAASPAATGGDEPAAVVDVNTAGPEELDTLPGVGPSTAAAIIEYRDANGPFASVEDLIDVPGIGDAKLAQLRDLVTV